MARQGAVGVEELILKKLATIRRWKKTKLMKRHSKWDFQFTVMTYNILSQTAVENHRYLYRNCNSSFVQEDYRISRIMPEILRSKSDIICLQEVEEHLFDNRIKQFFDSRGFASIFKRRTGCKSDGCAILWRKEKFNLVNHRDIDFRTKRCKLLNRDNIGLIAVLRPNHPKSRNTLLHVATTHLLFNPKRGDIKLCQIRWLLAELERMSLKRVIEGTRHYHPVILCGDFNFEPFSPLYRFVETGRIDIDNNNRSGDLSGQAEGRDKGAVVNVSKLLLHKLGVSDATRFEEVSSEDGAGEKLLETGNVHSPNQAPETSSGSSFVSKTQQGARDSTTSTFDQNILAAMGNSTDPRWIQTLLALGNKQLADKLGTHLQPGSNAQESLNSIQSMTIAEKSVPGSRLSDGEASDSDEEDVQRSFSHDLQFAPVYKYHNMNPKDIPITSMTGNDFNNVDHIFYNVKTKTDTTSFSEGKLRLLAVYSLLFAEDAKELGGLPNACLGSDHISLMAQFAISFNR